MDEVVRTFVEHRLTPCRHDLSLQLFMRSGPFWDAVGKVRDRWGIVPVTKVPTEADQIPYPPVCPEPTPQQPADADPIDWTRVALCWQEDVHDTLYPALPRRCRFPFTLWESGFWFQFLAACVRFDPPESALLAFADHALPTVDGDSDVTSLLDHENADEELRIVTPTMTITAVDRSAAWHRRYQRLLIDELHRRLEPDGIDLKALVREVQADPTFFMRLLARRSEPDRSQAQIVLTAETTEPEFRQAWKLLQPWFQVGRRGRPKIDDLTAVQTAIWAEQGMTQKEIADHFGWERHPQSWDTRERSNTTRHHITRGRELLQRRENSAD
jgi:hypothetical protein